MVDDEKTDAKRAELLKQAPIPTLWLFGKTASGKTSIVRYLTGATDAEIGTGYRPQTRFSKLYDFPDAESPVARFLDTRGVGEPGYDPQVDLKAFDHDANLLIVTVRAMDQSLQEVIEPLKTLRNSSPHRPVLLVLTCLHDGYPGRQHPLPDPFGPSLMEWVQQVVNSERAEVRSVPEAPQVATSSPRNAGVAAVPDDLRRSIEAQLKRFAGLFDQAIAIDLTPVSEGFEQPEFGGQKLKDSILELLPAAYRQTLLQLDELNQSFARAHQHDVAPIILGHSLLAATAAAVPIPWADIPLVLGIHTRLAYKIAKLNHQSLDAKTIAQVSTAMSGRVALQMGVRESLKFIPWVGIAANVAATFAFTFAAGWAWNWYFVQVKAGHVPTTDELRSVYRQQLKRGESFWKASKEKSSN